MDDGASGRGRGPGAKDKGRKISDPPLGRAPIHFSAAIQIRRSGGGYGARAVRTDFRYRYSHRAQRDNQLTGD